MQLSSDEVTLAFLAARCGQRREVCCLLTIFHVSIQQQLGTHVVLFSLTRKNVCPGRSCDRSLLELTIAVVSKRGTSEEVSFGRTHFCFSHSTCDGPSTVGRRLVRCHRSLYQDE